MQHRERLNLGHGTKVLKYDRPDLDLEFLPLTFVRVGPATDLLEFVPALLRLAPAVVRDRVVRACGLGLAECALQLHFVADLIVETVHCL